MSDAEKVEHEREVSLWEEHSPMGFTIVFSILALFAALGAFPYMVHREPAVAGQFGDSFGFINAFFSAFAVAGLLVTIVIQIKEYRLAQVERREALETQKEIGLQHAKNLDVQKQIAESYSSNMIVQKQMSDQQAVATIVGAIRTWSQMVGEKPEPPFGNMNLDYLHYLRQKSLYTLLLRLALSVSLKPREALEPLALQDNAEYQALSRKTSLAVDLAEVGLRACDLIAHDTAEDENKMDFVARNKGIVDWLTMVGNDIFTKASQTDDMLVVGDLNDISEYFHYSVDALRNAVESLNQLHSLDNLRQAMRNIAMSQRVNFVKHAHAVLVPMY